MSALRGGLATLGSPISPRDWRTQLVWLVPTLLLSLGTGIAGALAPWQAVAAGLAGMALLSVGLLAPALFLCVFVLVRPTLDSYNAFSIGVSGANPAGLVAGIPIALAAILPLVRRRVFVPPPLLPLALIVVLTTGSSAIALYDFGDTVGMEPVAEIVRITALGALYLLAANVISDERRIRALVVVAGLSGVYPALSAFRELIGGPALDALGLARVSGPFTGPNTLGMYQAFSALILIGMPKAWLSRSIRIPALVLIIASIVPTYSREGYICLLAGLVILEGRRHARMVVFGIAIAMAVVALSPTVQERVLPKSDPHAASNAKYESYGWRIHNWRGLLIKWSDQPLIGYGTRTTIAVNPRRPVATLFQKDGGFEAHNAAVRILVEGGLVLFAAYLAFGASIVRSLRDLSRRRWELQPLAHLLRVLWFVFVVVVLFTDDPFEQTAMMYTLLALTGALEGARWRARQAPPPVSP